MLQFIVCHTPFGDIFSMAYTQIDWGNFMRFVSLFGLSGVTFVICFFSSILHYRYLIWRDSEKNRSETSSVKMNLGFIIVFLLVLTYGGFFRSTYGGVFYQAPLMKTIPETIPAACLIDQYLYSNLTDVINRTDHLSRNHRLVLWSETAVSISSTEENEFISNLSAIAKTYQTLIGAAYLLELPVDSPNQLNLLTLISEQGEVLFRYQKSHPVPIVEAAVQPGPGHLDSVSTVIGRLSGAICFDLNYPWTMLQAAKGQVDLLLQPSWTWGPIGKWHYEINAVRAVELGVVIFRCGSFGYSGVYTPDGATLYNQPALYRADFEQILIPITKRVWTWYGLFGDVMAWICLVLCVLVYLPMAYVPLSIIEKLLFRFKDVSLFQKLLSPTEDIKE